MLHGRPRYVSMICKIPQNKAGTGLPFLIFLTVYVGLSLSFLVE